MSWKAGKVDDMVVVVVSIVVVVSDEEMVGETNRLTLMFVELCVNAVAPRTRRFADKINTERQQRSNDLLLE